MARQIFRKEFATAAYEKAPVSGLRQCVTLRRDR